MSAQRRRSSALSAARYNPFSRIISPVISLTRLIRGTYQSERESIGSSVNSTPAPSVAAGSGDLGDMNQRGLIPALNRRSHSASHGSNATDSVGLWNLIESQGSESDNPSDSDYAPPSSSESSVLTEIYSTTTEACDPSAGAVTRTSASTAQRLRTGIRQLCVNWAEETVPPSELEPGEILEDTSEVGLFRGSEPPSEIGAPFFARRIRTYEFRDAFDGGRLEFYPPLPGPPSINRWMYHPTKLVTMANNVRAIGDIDFNPAPGGGFEYYVYCEAPGTNLQLEYAWMLRQVGDYHPLHANYVLHHYSCFAPVWLRPPNPYADHLAKWEANAARAQPTASESPAKPSARRARSSSNEADPRTRWDADGDVRMVNASQALVVYNPSGLKRTRDDFESALPDRPNDAERKSAARKESPRKRCARDKDLPATPSAATSANHPEASVNRQLPPPTPPTPLAGPTPLPHPPNREAGPSNQQSNPVPRPRKEKAARDDNPADHRSGRAQHAGNTTDKGKSQTGHRNKGKRAETARGRASDFDDTDENDSDTETITSLYDNEPQTARDNDFAHMLTLLQQICGKLDQLLSAPPKPEDRTKQSSGKSFTPEHKPTTRRAARQKDNLRPWDQTKVHDQFVGPQTREETQKIVQGYIRTCFLSAFNIKTTTAGLPHGPPDDVIAPSMKNFYIKWDESVHSEFNQAACDLIVDKLMADFPKLFDPDSYDQLIKMVKSHAKYLVRAYRWQQLPADDPTDAQRHLNSSANRRMHTLFAHRMHVIDTVPELSKHRDLFVRLGIDGTSSDEEDPERPGIYRVKKIKQLSSSVRDLKQKVDETFDVLEKGRKVQGSRGRKRVPTNESSSRKFRIQGLPKNCVNRLWMQRLSDTQKSWFKFADYEYKFSFPDEFLSM
ncbi:hypothetical protein FRC09_016543 [Ceratobasidium sp. 395]|nr:hypothetical protein FRC09_016543 [Ceratobasidium sp. 395]